MAKGIIYRCDARMAGVDSVGDSVQALGWRREDKSVGGHEGKAVQAGGVAKSWTAQIEGGRVVFEPLKMIQGRNDMQRVSVPALEPRALGKGARVRCRGFARVRDANEESPWAGGANPKPGQLISGQLRGVWAD